MGNSNGISWCRLMHFKLVSAGFYLQKLDHKQILKEGKAANMHLCSCKLL